MKKLKVLQAIPSLSPSGGQRMAVNLAAELARDRFECKVVSFFNFGETELEKDLIQAAVSVTYLNKQKGFDPRVFLKLNRVIRDFSPDIVHTHLGALQYVALWAGLHKHPPIVHTVHSLAENEASRSGRLIRRLAFKRRIQPVVIAHGLLPSFTQLYCSSSPVVITNGIPIKKYKTPSISPKEWRESLGLDSNSYVFVCIANLFPQKNHRILIDAFVQAFPDDAKKYLFLVGDGNLRGYLERYVQACHVQPQIRFLGRRSDISNILHAANAFVLASAWEGNPLSIMEAMAAGCPVISTAVGGIPELIEPEQTGLLVSPNSVEELANAMKRLAANPELSQKLGGNAVRIAVARYDIALMIKKYSELYMRLSRAQLDQ